jgi:hypothetical protein
MVSQYRSLKSGQQDSHQPMWHIVFTNPKQEESRE